MPKMTTAEIEELEETLAREESISESIMRLEDERLNVRERLARLVIDNGWLQCLAIKKGVLRKMLTFERRNSAASQAEASIREL